MVVWLAVVRVGIAKRQPGDGAAEVGLGIGKPATAQQAPADRRVAAAVARVASQGFLVVGLGGEGGVAILFEVEAVEEQLLVRGDLRRRFRSGRGLRNGRTIPGSRGVRHERLAVGQHAQGQLRLDSAGRERDRHGERRLGRQGDEHLVQRGAEPHQPHVDLARRRDVDAHPCLGTAHLEPDGGVLARVAGGADLLVRHEDLREGLLLAGHDPGEIGLVVGVGAAHQLDVGAVGVGELAVPGPAELAVAPGPLLLAGHDVVVGHVQEPGAGAVVVAAEEVVVGMVGHVRRGYGDGVVPRDVGARRIVDLVVRPRGDREVGHGPLAVVHHGVDVGREDRLVLVVHVHRRIGPPEKRLRLVGAVQQVYFDLEVGPARVQLEPVAALGAEHPLDLGAPHRAVVIVRLDSPVDRLKRAGAVVLRPVELDPARDPGAAQTHERGLDHAVVVNEVVAVGLVEGHLDPPAELGQDHDLEVVVLEEDGRVGPVDPLANDPVDDRVRVDDAAAPLVDALLEEHRVAVGRTDGVGRDHDRFGPRTDLRHVGGTAHAPPFPISSGTKPQQGPAGTGPRAHDVTDCAGAAPRSQWGSPARRGLRERTAAGPQ